MKKALLIAVGLLLCSVSLMPSAGAEQTGYQWIDHFNYSST